MTKIWRGLLVGLIAVFSLPLPIHAAIATPDTFSIATVEAYQNCRETGDQLYLITGSIKYGTIPVEGSTYELFRLKLMDGATELGSDSPYAYYNHGYDYFVLALYFSAADVATKSMTWGDGSGYEMVLEGNSAYSWADGAPSISIDAADFGYYSGATVMATDSNLTVRVRTLSIAAENIWGVDITEFINGVRKFTQAGEDYFTTVIPYLRQMCPLLYSTSITTPDFPERDNVVIGYTGGDDSDSAVYSTHWVSQTFTATSAFSMAGVYFKFFKTGSPGDVTVSLQGTAAGEPDGSDLATGTFDTSTSSISAEWDNAVFDTPYTVTKGEVYAIVFSIPSGDIGNSISLRTDTNGVYTDGQVYTSVNSGTAWTGAASSDIMFTIYAENANNLTWLQQWEGRLIGSPFDLTAVATSLNMPRMLLTTLVWFAIAFGCAFYVTRRANNFNAGWPTMGIIIVVGGPLGACYAAISIALPILVLLGALYATLKPAR